MARTNGLISCIRPVAILVLCSVATACRFFPEACFDLSSESRIPDWFSLPSGTTRGEVAVRMCYYIVGGRTAIFELRHAKNDKPPIADVSGTLRGLYPQYPPNSPAAETHGYPSYEVITVGDISEVIEHRRAEPLFYVVDDPAIRHAFGVVPANRAAASNHKS